jgi:SAM-dependent methyltransferase
MADLSIETENLDGKIILEVGSGRGDTTRKLADLVLKSPRAQLIATDISERYFQPLRQEFLSKGLSVRFLCTGAQELHSIANASVDHLVCHYTLCAVNAQAGAAALALRRFWEVLAAGGKLWIEEEFPVEKRETPAQAVWAQKWRILKAAQILAGRSPYHEIAPDVLEGLCRLAGFGDIQWIAYREMIDGVEALDFFQKRLEALLPELQGEKLAAGFGELAARLRDEAAQAGGMEIPYYRLTARKSQDLCKMPVELVETR